MASVQSACWTSASFQCTFMVKRYEIWHQKSMWLNIFNMNALKLAILMCVSIFIS